MKNLAMDNSMELRGYGLEEAEKQVASVGITLFLISFILLNAVKLTAFNFVIMPVKTFDTFAYKLVFALLANLVIYTLFFKLRSRWPFILVYAAQSVYIFSNLSYFSYFGGYLHLFQASALLTEGVGPIRHFTIPVKPEMLVMLIDMPVFAVLALQYTRISGIFKSIKPHIRTARYFSLALLICLEIWNYFSGTSLIQLNKNFFISETKIIERYGTLVNNISDITVNYGGANLIKHFKYGESISAFAETAETAKAPNIIAIQVESMDAAVINQQHNGKYIAPFLHSLAQENIYYPYVLSYHKSGGTSDSEFSILNSIEPLSSYPSIKLPKYEYPNSFVKQLDQDHYYTMAFHGNKGNYYNRDVAFTKMGFDEFNDIEKMKLPETGWGAPDDKVFDYAFNKMENTTAPFLSYVITMSSHMPFTNILSIYDNSDYHDIVDETVRNYFNSMSYVDQSIEAYVKKVREKYPNSVIMIWGDHTPAITAEDYKQASFTENNLYFEFVPLIISTPEGKKYTEDSNVASFLDIAPTILNATGLGYQYKSDGIDLINLPEGRPEIPFKEKYFSRSTLFGKISGKIEIAN